MERIVGIIRNPDLGRVYMRTLSHWNEEENDCRTCRNLTKYEMATERELFGIGISNPCCLRESCMAHRFDSIKKMVARAVKEKIAEEARKIYPKGVINFNDYKR